MKKIFALFILAVALIFSNLPVTNAADVWLRRDWIDRDGGYPVDIYIVEDSIRLGNENSGRYIRVITKEVIYGQLVKSVQWLFRDSMKTSEWRYYTKQANRNLVTFPEILLRHCLNYLGEPF